MKLNNHTILITGGTSGIGFELGRKLLAMGNTVILLGRDKHKLEAAAVQGFETLRCDLSNLQDVEQAALYIQNHFPGINILFNNAGVQYNYAITETVIPLEKIRHEMEVNVSGQIVLTQQLIPLLATAEKALIVNTTSGLGIFPKSDGLVYSASKAAMRNFTTGLRYALKETSIGVLEMIPPVTDTAMTSGRNEKKMSVRTFVEAIIPQIERERKIATVPAIRVFLWIAFLMPGLANKILSKK